MHIPTQIQWDNFRKKYSNQPEARFKTFEDFFQHSVKEHRYQHFNERAMVVAEEVNLGYVKDCGIAVGFVVFDIICLALGAAELRAQANRVTANAIADVVEPVMAEIEKWVKVISDESAGKIEKGKAMFNILQSIYSGGYMGGVIKAFKDTLTWYYAILYGVIALATIVAIFATEGLAFFALVAIELATFGFLILDCIDAVKKCLDKKSP